MTIRVPDPPPLPEEVAKLIDGKPDVASSSTQLSIYRTRLSTYRTHVSNLRSHLSNERTHLSYLRTSVSLIGFGITLNKFAQYMIQNDPKGATTPLADARHVGSGMVILGLLLLTWSLYRFWVVSKDIEQGKFVAHYRAVFIASLGLLVIGGGSALWMFFS